MGTDIDITIFREQDCVQDVDTIFDLFKSLELEFSRFLNDSSLSLLNTNRSLEVSDTFIDIIHICKQLHHDTHGYFNPLVNLSKIGYSKSFDLKQFTQQDIKDINLNFDDVQIDGNIVTLQKYQTLDLGGIVKGFAVDLARKYLNSKGYKNYIINAGGDIYTAGTNEEGGKIVVGIDNPFIPGDLFGVVRLTDKAVATSGTYKRKRTIDTTTYNHILNPITGENNNEIISITLIVDDCYLADAYATVCIAMGLEKALLFLESKHIDGIFICSDGIIHQTKGMEIYKLLVL